jgi:hypothetical protein
LTYSQGVATFCSVTQGRLNPDGHALNMTFIKVAIKQRGTLSFLRRDDDQEEKVILISNLANLAQGK